MAGKQASAAGSSGSSDKGMRGLGYATYAAWALCALLVGIAADVLTPLGPFVVFLLGVFIVVAASCALLSFLPAGKKTFRAATIFALWGVFVFGAIAALQHYGVKQPDGGNRGFLATSTGIGEDLQNLVLAEAARRDPPPPPPAVAIAAVPAALSPSEAALQALSAAIASPDPAERVRAATEALANADPAILAPAIEKLYLSNDAALRQAATVKLPALRQGAGLPLLVIGADEANKPFADALQGANVRLTRVDERAGFFEGSLCSAAGMSGTVNRTGASLAGKCAIGETSLRTVLALTTTDDFRLTGEARNDQGQVVRVEIPLR